MTFTTEQARAIAADALYSHGLDKDGMFLAGLTRALNLAVAKAMEDVQRRVDPDNWLLLKQIANEYRQAAQPTRSNT